MIDRSTGEILFTFSKLTINATDHPVIKHFHKPKVEKRSIVILQDSDNQNWLYADLDTVRQLLQLAPDDYLKFGPPLARYLGMFMKTELLNKFLFSDLVEKRAQ